MNLEELLEAARLLPGSSRRFPDGGQYRVEIPSVEARGRRSMAEIAALSGVPAETLRKIETGRIATPAFFTVAALAATLGLSLQDIVAQCAADGQDSAAALTA